MPSPWNPETYIKALKFAANAHNGQTIPGTDLPYVIHPTMVAMEIITALGHEEDLDGDLAVQCALLHDVIEDTDITYDALAAEFDSDVADGVQALTKNTALGSKKNQMTDSLKRIKQQPQEIQMVKLADRITNLQPPPGYWDAGKIERYRKEAELILDELGEACTYLADRLRQKIMDYTKIRLFGRWR
ncbi:MAG: bifunctional (p)ppGpp synthetase/guanosine-3',5'-bis(diphosphate) 3'-pyrophosphohydrolase [Desulfobacteraceae bacterium]|nr:bifunctional (p)ppGpp synthetase/guanosine-3',5'-bis(diphosphate) 3'-pyrophosphohydrolase [Desulfobacteraceae bacterium]